MSWLTRLKEMLEAHEEITDEIIAVIEAADNMNKELKPFMVNKKKEGPLGEALAALKAKVEAT